MLVTVTPNTLQAPEALIPGITHIRLLIKLKLTLVTASQDDVLVIVTPDTLQAPESRLIHIQDDASSSTTSSKGADGQEIISETQPTSPEESNSLSAEATQPPRNDSLSNIFHFVGSTATHSPVLPHSETLGSDIPETRGSQGYF